MRESVFAGGFDRALLVHSFIHSGGEEEEGEKKQGMDEWVDEYGGEGRCSRFMMESGSIESSTTLFGH